MTGGPDRTVLQFLEKSDEFDESFGGMALVLDPGWVPHPTSDDRIRSVLPLFFAVIERHDLYKESLDLVDAWAERVGAIDRLHVEGISFWHRIRETMWNWVHERLIWEYVLDDLDPTRRLTLRIPGSETALIDVATASERRHTVVNNRAPAFPGPRLRARLVGRLPAALRRSYRQFRPHPDTIRAQDEVDAQLRRDEYLARRLATMRERSDRPVVVLSQPASAQVVGEQRARADPNLATVLPALEAEGCTLIVINWPQPRVDGPSWHRIEAQDNVIPGYFVRSHWSAPEDLPRAQDAVAHVVSQLSEIPGSIRLGQTDLGAAFAQAVLGLAGPIVDADVRDLLCIERLLVDFAPRAVLMTHEGHRSPWLLAAKRASVPSFALQHGVLYESHPGYPQRRDDRHVLPTTTFVFGDYEKRILLGWGYLDNEVFVSGAPRVDLAERARSRLEVDTATIRESLGVAEGDRLLVVSTGWHAFMRRTHLAHMITTLLGSPMPGVHIVFKQHPAEQDEGRYRALIESIAAAKGFAAPRVTVIRDIDLFSLLRAADAHLGHHSTVLTEAVVAQTCNLVARVQACPPVIDYEGAGVATAIRSPGELLEALRCLPRPSAGVAQRFIDDHYRPGSAGPRIARAITGDRLRLASPSMSAGGLS